MSLEFTSPATHGRMDCCTWPFPVSDVPQTASSTVSSVLKLKIAVVSVCCLICRAAKVNKYLDPCYKHLFIELILFFAKIKAEVMRGVKEGEGNQAPRGRP
jgi:hypothetical protein